jgi:glycosyltransferase involved in cell wall biosynthesis
MTVRTTGRSRILMPMLASYPSALASTVQSVNMAQAFAERGHDVMLVAANNDPSLATVLGATDAASLYGFTPAFRTRVLSVRSRRGQSYINAVRIARLVRQERPDLILSRDLRGCLIPAILGVPTVFEAHSLTALLGRQERWAISRLLRTPAFRGFVVISEPLAQDLAREFDVPKDRILVAHDAVRPEDPGPSAGAAPDGRSPTDRPLRIGYTGSLFAGRGIELLIEVAGRAPWAELHLVGGPADVANALRERLADLPGGRIVIHGMVTPIRARELQREADVLVAPFARKVGTDSGVDTSRWMSPMKVFEYMASGRPIVISDLPVLREILRPEVDALMVTPEDPDALLAALERLRDDPDLGRRLASSAQERVHAEFTWDRRAQKVLSRFLPGALKGA